MKSHHKNKIIKGTVKMNRKYHPSKAINKDS